MNADIGSPDRNIEIGDTRSGSASEMLKIFEGGVSPPVRQPGATSIRRSGPRKPSRNPCFSGVRGSFDGNVQNLATSIRSPATPLVRSRNAYHRNGNDYQQWRNEPQQSCNVQQCDYHAGMMQVS
jgi:hypothetical protein